MIRIWLMANLSIIKGCVRYIFASLFLRLNESTRQTRENVFYFTWKALFVFEKIKFQNSSFSNFVTSSNASAKNKCILLNNVGSKHSLLMKWPGYVILEEKKFDQKILQKLHPEN